MKLFQMYIFSDMWIKMAYQNTTHGLWEAIIEPMEEVIDGLTVYTPWQIKLDVIIITL